MLVMNETIPIPLSCKVCAWPSQIHQQSYLHPCKEKDDKFVHNKTFNLQTTVSSYKCIPGRSQKKKFYV